MKKISLFIFMAFSVVASIAQEKKEYTMRVWNNGSYTSFSIESVDSITFAEEVKPDNVTTENGYQSESSFKEALSSIYARFQTFITSEKKIEELALDGGYESISASNPTIKQAWTNGYSAINYCNRLIEFSLGKDYPFDVKKYRGQAIILRSIIYYMMAQIWGDIPYIETTNIDIAFNPPIVSKQEIIYDSYNLITTNINDVQEIIEYPSQSVSSKNIRPLLNEMAMYIEGKPYESCTTLENLIMQLDNSAETYTIVDDTYNQLLEKEFSKSITAEELATLWKDARPRYGVWLALKRLKCYTPANGMAECLLFPIPEEALMTLPCLKQNEGY